MRAALYNYGNCYLKLRRGKPNIELSKEASTIHTKLLKNEMFDDGNHGKHNRHPAMNVTKMQEIS